jgi:hypothetical protein
VSLCRNISFADQLFETVDEISLNLHQGRQLVNNRTASGEEDGSGEQEIFL